MALKITNKEVLIPFTNVPEGKIFIDHGQPFLKIRNSDRYANAVDLDFGYYKDFSKDYQVIYHSDIEIVINNK